MIEPFLVRAGLAGLGTALAAAPLGCFVVWRGMAFFGDATAHAALLGVAFALALDVPIFAGALAAALAMATGVAWLSSREVSPDTVLGVLSHSALAFGLVAVAFLEGVRVDLVAYLFGEILAVGWGDLAVIWGGAALVTALMAWRWSALLTMTLDADLARAAGLDPRREAWVLTVALAAVVAVAIKVVGALLIAALLVIPPAAARPFARSPEAMAVLAAGIGGAAALGGLWASFLLDTPTGPTIVCLAALAFAASTALAALRG